MRVALFALLAVGAIHTLPLDHPVQVEASGDEGSGLAEGSGNLQICPPELSEQEIEASIRSHTNEASSSAEYNPHHQSRLVHIKTKKDDSKSSEETTTVRIVHDNSKSHEDSHEESHRSKRDTEATVEAVSVVAKDLMEQAKKNTEEVLSSLRQLADNATTTEASVEEEGSGSETTVAAPKCKLLEDCLDDTDCNGGRCMGAFLGTCNCGSCMSFLRCKTDAECGGFNKACNTTTGTCDCYGAYVLNGYKDTFDALGKLCNVKQCGRDTAADDCHGLGCNRGRCFC